MRVASRVPGLRPLAGDLPASAAWTSIGDGHGFGVIDNQKAQRTLIGVEFKAELRFDGFV
jgi:hypothetical protein